MARVNQDDFFADDESHCSAWTQGEALFVCTGDGVLKLEGARELHQFIEYLREIKRKKVQL